MNAVLQLMLAIGIVGSNSLLLSPIASSVAQSFAHSEASDVLLASAVFGLGTALSALLLAPKADQLGLRLALRASIATLFAGLLLSAIAPSLWLLCAGQAIAGLATGVTLPCVYSLAAEIAPNGKENETLGKVLLGWTLSLVGGVTLASFVADVWHWRVVYALLVCGAAFVFFALPANTANTTSKKMEQRANHNAWHALRIEGVVNGLCAVAIFMAAFYGVYGFLGTHLTTTLGESVKFTSLAALLYGIGFGIVAPIDTIMDKYGAVLSRALVFSILVLVYLALAASSESSLLILSLCFLWGASNHLALNLLVARLTSIDPDNRAAIMGLYSATTYLAMFVGTLAFKVIFDVSGFSFTGLLAALLITPMAVNASRLAMQSIQRTSSND